VLIKCSNAKIISHFSTFRSKHLLHTLFLAKEPHQFFRHIFKGKKYFYTFMPHCDAILRKENWETLK